jgi:hypothetical protein
LKSAQEGKSKKDLANGNWLQKTSTLIWKAQFLLLQPPLGLLKKTGAELKEPQKTPLARDTSATYLSFIVNLPTIIYLVLSLLNILRTIIQKSSSKSQNELQNFINSHNKY